APSAAAKCAAISKSAFAASTAVTPPRSPFSTTPALTTSPARPSVYRSRAWPRPRPPFGQRRGLSRDRKPEGPKRAGQPSMASRRGRRHEKKPPAAPQAEAVTLVHGKLHEVQIERARDERLEAAAHAEVGLESLAGGLDCKAQRVHRTGLYDVVDVGAKHELLLASLPVDLHLHRQERRVRNVYVHL